MRPLQGLLEGRGIVAVQAVADLAAACLATLAVLAGAHAPVGVAAVNAPLLALPPLMVLLLYLRGLYQTHIRASALDSVVPGVSAVSVAAMAVVVLGLLVNGTPPDQTTSLWVWGVAVIAVGAGRTALAVGQRFARSHRLIGSPVLIIGAGAVGTQVARRLESHPEYGLRPVGLLDDSPRPPADVGRCELPVLGKVKDVDEVVARTGVRNLIVAFSSVSDARISHVIQHCQELGVEVSVVPRMFDTINNRVIYDTVGGLPLLSFHSVSPKGAQFALKHALDRAVAAVLLMLLAPLLIAVAVAVRLSSPGPVLFRQRRVGRDAKVFDLYKFRSMRMPGPAAVDQPARDRAGDPPEGTGEDAAEGREARSAAEGDGEPWVGRDIAPGGVEGADRRTGVGRVIRRFGLDELPQLVNVVQGEMSLVGPRPERPEYVELFEERLDRYDERLRVKSGITGWAQVHGLRGNTSLAERIEWDNYYIANWSLGLDLKILLLTVLAVLRGAE